MTRIGVIGAGITGVTAAYALCERGYDVTVFDQNRYAAMETSFANGGQLSASNAEVWNKVSTVWQGLRWMLRRDAPLLMNPKPSWHKYSWMAEFVRHIPNYRQNTIETVRLAIEARRHMFAIAERENIDFDLQRFGILHFYRDKASFDKASEANKLLNEGGLERRSVTPEEIRQIEPTLKGSYHGGFFTPSDSTGDIHKFTRGLAEACARRGVRFFYDAQVEKVVPKDGGLEVRWLPVAPDDTKAAMDRWRPIRVDGIVICAGSSSRRFAAMLGDRLNIYPVKGYSITVHLHTPEAQAAAPTVSILDEATKIVTSRLGRDRFRVAGTAEFSGFNLDIRYDRIRPLIDWSREQFPAMTTDRVVAWSGLRPMMPSMMPRVGPGRRPGVFYNTGHGHLGWTLSAATAQMLADAVEKAMPVAAERIAAKPAADAA
jgi:D-amino-acid dehydrogenase